MSVRAYSPMALSPAIDPKLRSELLKVDTWLRQLSVNMARVPALPMGTPAAGGAIDLSSLPYLYLPGRPDGQYAKGSVTFDVLGSFAPSTTTIDGLHFLAYQSIGGIVFKNVITFSVEATGYPAFSGSPFVQQWRFPALSGTNGEQMIFVDTSHSQSLNRKTMASLCKYQLNEGSAQFQDGSGGKDLRFALTNLGAAATLTVYYPNASGSNTFVLMNGNASAPYPPGSILYGSSAGTLMNALANGTSGQVLVSGGGTAAPTWVSPAALSGVVPDTRQINTTAPLTGGGALSGDLTLDIDVFTSIAEGTVPASGGGTSNFLRADGSWAAPAGGAGATSIARTFALMGA